MIYCHDRKGTTRRLSEGFFHIIHTTGELNEQETWYDDVFAVKVFMPHSYMPGERRHASLVLLGDTVIEPLAPAFSEPDWAEFPLGRFYDRFGNHRHSIAFNADGTNSSGRTVAVLVHDGVQAGMTF